MGRHSGQDRCCRTNPGIPAVNVGGAVVYGEPSDGQSNSIVIVDDDIGERV